MLLGILLSVGNLFARAYGTNEKWETGYCVLPSQDGGFLMAGMTSIPNSQDRDAIVIKCNAQGSPIWAKTLKGYEENVLTSGCLAQDGGYVLAGWSCSSGGNPGIFLVKLSPSGQIAWIRSTGYSVWLKANAVFPLGDQIVVVCTNSNENYIIFIALDLSGNVKRVLKFSLNRSIGVYSATQTSDGGFVLAGFYREDSGREEDFLVVKFDQGWQTDWCRVIATSGSSRDSAQCIIQTEDGGYIVCGVTTSGSSTDALAVKLDGSGNLQWANLVDCDGARERFLSGVSVGDNGAIILGTVSLPSSDNDLMLVRLDDVGNITWSWVYRTTKSTSGVSLARLTDGGVACLGWANNIVPGDVDFLFIKTGDNGEYPSCLDSLVLTASAPTTLLYSRDTFLIYTSLVFLNPQLQNESPSIRSIDVCQSHPDVEEEQNTNGKIVARSVRKGLVFFCVEPVGLKIYRADGVMVKDINLRAGKNFLPMRPGVYFWVSEETSGSIAVQ